MEDPSEVIPLTFKNQDVGSAAVYDDGSVDMIFFDDNPEAEKLRQSFIHGEVFSIGMTLTYKE